MRRVLPVLCFTVLAFGVISWRGDAFAQDVTITNLTQLVDTALSANYSLYLPWTPWQWRAYPLDNGEPWWVDCSQVACADLLSTSTDLCATVEVHGVQVTSVVLTRDVLTGETLLQSGCSTDVIAVIAAPSGYEPGTDLGYNAWVWREWQDVTNCLDCWGLTADEIPPPIVTLKTRLADVLDYATWSNAEAEAEAAAYTSSAFSFTTMGDDDDGGGGDPCSITNLTQPFYVTSITQGTDGTTITWQSCPMFRYVVLSADALSMNTAWAAQGYTSYIWGQPGASATSWTDLSTTNTSVVTQRFYKVERLPTGGLIAAGALHSLALALDGLLGAWGDNSNGQLGDGTLTSETFPVAIVDPLCGAGGMSNVQALAGGFDYSVVADANGACWTWGDNNVGQLGNGGATSNFLTPSSITGVSNVASVAAGDSHTLALRADETVWAWGDDSDGQLGVGGLAAGSTNSPIRSLIPSGTNIVAIAAGDTHSVAVDTIGRVWAWGFGGDGELGNGGTSDTNLPMLLTTISNVVAIAAGDSHTIALTTNGTVWTWGDNSKGELGRTGDVTRPGPVLGLSNVVSIAGGLSYTLAVTSNGQVHAWGDNTYGELGTNGISSSSTPLLVAGLSNAIVVSSHPEGAHSLAVTVNQGILQYWVWGDNQFDEVGNGTSGSTVDTPTLVLFPDFYRPCATCVQLGTNGTLTAPATGILILYFNDNKPQFSDNSGSYTASITGFGSVTVAANNNEGVVIGTVTNGVNYAYTASGFCLHSNSPSSGSDADGNMTNGVPWDCSSIDMSTFICPSDKCYSLVGRIE